MKVDLEVFGVLSLSPGAPEPGPGPCEACPGTARLSESDALSKTKARQSPPHAQDKKNNYTLEPKLSARGNTQIQEMARLSVARLRPNSGTKCSQGAAHQVKKL